MKESVYKTYTDLPLFLNAETVAKALGVSPASSYELMHEADFPVLKVGNRLIVPKEKFVVWVEQHTKGGEIACADDKTSVVSSLSPVIFFFLVSTPVNWQSTPSCSAVKTERLISAGPATKRLAEQQV